VKVCQHGELLATMELKRKRTAVWRLEGNLPGIGALPSVIDAAFAAWSKVANVSGRQMVSGESPDLVIRCAQMDGPGKVLGETQLPGPATQLMTLDMGEDWRSTNLLAVITHELGHFWGLGHAPQQSPALMAPYYRDSVVAPNGWDVSQMVGLYGPPVPVAPSEPDLPPEEPSELAGSLVIDPAARTVKLPAGWRVVAGLCLALAVAGTATAQTPASTNKVDGLALPADQTVTAGDQFVEIEAATKGEVTWDVFAVFEADVKLRTKEFGKSILIGVPASPGAIRVSACALVDGKLTRIASTIITVAPGKGAPPPAAGGKVAITKGPKLYATLIGAQFDPETEKELRAADVTPFAYAATDPRLAKERAALLKRAVGAGLPGLVLQDAVGKPVGAWKVAGDADIRARINGVRGK